MFNSQEMALMFLNIVKSWNVISDVFLSHGNTSITEIMSEMTIELTTLKSSILEIMPASIILEGMTKNGLWLNANIVQTHLSDSAHNYQLNNIAPDSVIMTLVRQMECKLVSIANRLSTHQNHIIGNSVQIGVPPHSSNPKKSCALSMFVNSVGLSLSQSLVESQNTADENAWRQPIKNKKVIPCWEPILLARKKLIGTVVENVLTHGTGAINIDACRIQTDDGESRARPPRTPNEIFGGGKGTNLTVSPHNDLGRFPGNIVHDGSDEVMEAFAAFGNRSSGAVKKGTIGGHDKNRNVYGSHAGYEVPEIAASAGSAARFYFCAKVSAKEREGSKHPSIKPLELMRYLCRLVCPKGGLILDPFAGTGTTGLAAIEEGFNAVLIEKENEYCEDIRQRLGFFLEED
ncbi:unnamed protein product [Sphagnum tenellum]